VATSKASASVCRGDTSPTMHMRTWRRPTAQR
jgi:hypothetical protein